jgi:PAS domain S-box-containing protein
MPRARRTQGTATRERPVTTAGINAIATDEFSHWVRTQLFDDVPIAICVIDRRFRIVEANRTFTETYGPWSGRSCFRVYKNLHDRCEQCGAIRTFADGQTRVREERGLLQDGSEISYLVHMLPIKRPDGEIPYVVEMSTDITHIKKLEKEKLEAERLGAVGETVAGIAHGIKNVLMGLEGGVYVVNSGLRHGDGERFAKGWSMLQENITRISSFVKEFLDFAKGRKTAVAFIDPNLPARQVYELFRDSAAQSKIDLRLHLQKDLDPAPLDANGIHTCLVNLVSNAIDACLMSEGHRKFHVTLTTRDEDGVLIYEVADNGRGIDYEISRKIFTSFFSTKGSTKGTGLGLLTTKKIVYQHGGKVSFDSTENKGSVFRIELPRHRLPNPSENDEDEQTKPAAEGAKA